MCAVGDQEVGFSSILSARGLLQETRGQPEFFKDLNLDQLVRAISNLKKDYDIKPFYYTLLKDEDQIRYRQEIFRDLEDQVLMSHILTFAKEMSRVNRYVGMTKKLHYEHHKNGWLLEAVLAYCEAVQKLEQGLGGPKISSAGLNEFRRYLTAYLRSPRFQVLFTEARDVKQALGRLEYSIIIQSGRFTVKAYEGEQDYTPEIEKTFRKFREKEVKEYVSAPTETGGMNHVEAKILEFVARLYPEPFAALQRFCSRHNLFMDEVISGFEREVQFYLAYLEFIQGLKSYGLPFSYPEVSKLDKEEEVQDGYDLALAAALFKESNPVVCNDYCLKGPERILIVTGPNQGGKTTFARMFGQLHYLAVLGCPVPARRAKLFLCRNIFTHFEREEHVSDLRGKLQDDLVRIRDILWDAGPDSLLVINEIFASTTLEDAILLSRKIVEKLMDLDALCVWVTFLDELSRLGEKTVSMVGTVDPRNPTVRTFRILRKPADGLAYALSIARKHRVTYEQIKERVRQ